MGMLYRVKTSHEGHNIQIIDHNDEHDNADLIFGSYLLNGNVYF